MFGLFGSGNAAAQQSTLAQPTLLIATVRLTNAQIKNLAGQPITLVPAPGAQRTIRPWKVEYFWHIVTGYTGFVGAAYVTASNNLDMEPIEVDTSINNDAQEMRAASSPPDVPFAIDTTAMENQPLLLSATYPVLGGGDAANYMTATTYYRVLTR